MANASPAESPVLQGFRIDRICNLECNPRFSTEQLPAHFLCSAPLGIAVASIDALVTLARTKVAFTSDEPLGEQEHVQLEVTWATTRLRAARAFASESIGSLWTSVTSGQPASVEQQAPLRMACWDAGDAEKEVVGRMYAAAGSTTVLE